ncbi:MAG: PQQ-binding-like beta-propeller repeat protein [Acidimicrobiales bacterium]
MITHTAEPRRRRRRQRTVDRIRIGIAVMLGLVASTTLSALPIAEDFATGTLDFFSIGPAEPEIGRTEPEPETVPVTVDQPSLRVFDDSVWVDPTMVGVAPPGPVEGLLTFRGSPTRSFYGVGPIPSDPEVRWRYPETGGLCRASTVGTETSTWCGTGWTGQPAIFRRDDRLWTIFGALDGAVHFLDAVTGESILRPFQTADIIKGSVTVDPDGYPIVYTGSRDNQFRLIAFDGEEPRELWRLDAESFEETRWNNDWDGAALVLDDHLFIGGENSRIHIVRLNRSFDAEGRVAADPEVVFSAPGWDAELIRSVGDDNVSIENSVTISGDTMYFANSAGLVQGWDIAALRTGGSPEQVFRFWVGDDVDATIVADVEGMLYVAVEFERGTARSRELGQLIKLDPTKRGDEAVVWAVDERQGLDTGVWGTPALHRGAVIFGSEGGNLRAVDQQTGESLWQLVLGFHLWQSPVVVDDVLLMGDCSGTLRAFDVSNPRVEPELLWALPLDNGCIESTPAVWAGSIVVGTRGGAVYGVAQK